MAKVEIYTWQACPFCMRAKTLLDSKRVQYQEHRIDDDQNARNLMANRADGRNTLPQIFIDDVGIGGCDELHALEQTKTLDALLGFVS